MVIAAITESNNSFCHTAVLQKNAATFGVTKFSLIKQIFLKNFDDFSFNFSEIITLNVKSKIVI